MNDPNENVFSVLLNSPGLHHLIEDHLLDVLPIETLVNLELVSKAWRNFVINNQIWRKRLEVLRDGDDFIDAFCIEHLDSKEEEFADFGKEN